MPLHRRKFLISLTLFGAALDARVLAQPSGSPLPDKRRFQSGDLLWPKRPGAYVPYNSGEAAERDADERRWRAERDICVARLRGEPRHFTAHGIESLANLDYAEFHARYAAGMEPGMPAPYGADSAVSVGHVGILEIDAQGQPWVIEALLDRGVVRQTYEEWLKSRPGEVVWHGRLRHPDPSALARISTYARTFLGRPYDFWNFDLSDEAGFYCSKLVWLSVNKALGIAVDGNTNPKRMFWFSPKQLMNAPSVEVLQSPGPPY